MSFFPKRRHFHVKPNFLSVRDVTAKIIESENSLKCDWTTRAVPV